MATRQRVAMLRCVRRWTVDGLNFMAAGGEAGTMRAVEKSRRRWLGTPGRYARSLMLRSAGMVVAAAVMVLAGVGVLAWFGPRTLRGAGPVEAVMAIVAATAAVAAAVLMSRQRVAFFRARAGWQAERQVWKVLRTSSGRGVAGLMTDRGDIDVVVTSPGLVVIEVKHGRGVVRVSPTGEWTVNGRRWSANPVRQVRAQAEIVQRRIGVVPRQVVCVSGMSNAAFSVDGVMVCGAADLCDVLDGLKTTGEVELDAVVTALASPRGR